MVSSRFLPLRTKSGPAVERVRASSSTSEDVDSVVVTRSRTGFASRETGFTQWTPLQTRHDGGTDGSSSGRRISRIAKAMSQTQKMK